MDDKCCRKAFHDVIYLCDNIYNWQNISLSANTTPPTCSERCANALRILYSDHVGKNLKCCKCRKFSDVDQNNLNALKVIERCHAGRINLENICKISRTSGCNKSSHTFEGNQEYNFYCMYSYMHMVTLREPVQNFSPENVAVVYHSTKPFCKQDA